MRKTLRKAWVNFQFWNQEIAFGLSSKYRQNNRVNSSPVSKITLYFRLQERTVAGCSILWKSEAKLVTNHQSPVCVKWPRGRGRRDARVTDTWRALSARDSSHVFQEEAARVHRCSWDSSRWSHLAHCVSSLNSAQEPWRAGWVNTRQYTFCGWIFDSWTLMTFLSRDLSLLV